MDVLAVYRACQWAKEWTTSGKGPLVMELTTYRYGGHSMSDPGTTYRTREEIQHMRSTADPIQGMLYQIPYQISRFHLLIFLSLINVGLKARLLDLGVATEDQLKAIDKEARKIVDQAVKEAEASPEPDMKEFYSEGMYIIYKGKVMKDVFDQHVSYFIVYIEGSEPKTIRGREPGESKHF